MAQGPNDGAHPTLATKAPEATLRRVWAGSHANFYPGASSPSPDGRYVTEVDWSTGDLAVRDLTTGDVHRLTDKGSWQDSGDYALSSTFSPDGSRVAYSWWNNGSQRFEVRVVDFAVGAGGRPPGSSERVVYSNPGLRAYVVHDWSPDGAILATLRRPGDRTTALAFISVDDGRVRVLESYDWRIPNAVMSPDGRFVAYDLPTDTRQPERDIYLLSVESGGKATLVAGADDEAVLGWGPAGALTFASRGARGTTFWKQPMLAGEPSGPAELLYEGLLGHSKPLGFAGDILYYGVVVESPSFHVGEVNLEGDRLLPEPVPIENPYDGRSDAWDWSPDGRHYAMAVSDDAPESGFHVIIGSVDGPLPRVKSFHGPGRVERLRWAPGRETLVLYGFDENGRPGIRTLDLTSGDIETVRRFDHDWGAMGGHIAVGPNGREVFFRQLARGALVSQPTEGTVLALDLETGGERAIQSVTSGGSVAISSDGEWLAFVDYDEDAGEPVTLRVMPTAGGPSRVVARRPRGEIMDGLNWTPDGRRIVFRGGPQSDPGLRAVPSGGGSITSLDNAPSIAHADLRLHPDGRRIAFLSGGTRGEIWAMEGLGAPRTKRPAEGDDSR